MRASLRACVRDRDERRQNIRTHPKKHAAVCAIRSAPSPPSSSYPPHVPRSFGFGTRHAQHNTQHVHTQKHNENTCQREKHMPCFLFPFTERKPGGTRSSEDDRGGESHRLVPTSFSYCVEEARQRIGCVGLERRGAASASSEDPRRKVSKRTPFAGKARCRIYSLLIHLYCIYCTRISKLLELTVSPGGSKLCSFRNFWGVMFWGNR